MMKKYRNLLKLKVYIKNCKISFCSGIIIMLICSIIDMPIPYLMGDVIDKVLLPHKSYIDLCKIIGALIILNLAKYCLSIIYKKLFIIVQNFIVSETRSAMIDKIIDLPMSFLDKNEKGYVLSRVAECDEIGNIFSPTYVSMVLEIFNFIFSIISMFLLNYKLTIITLVIIPIYFFVTKRSTNKLLESTNILLESKAELSGEVYEILNGIMELKVLNCKEKQIFKFKNKLNDSIIKKIKQNNQITYLTENVSIVGNIGYILILFFSGIMVLNDQLTIGIYTSFVAYMNKVLIAISAIASLEIIFGPACISIKRISEFLKMKDEYINDGKKMCDSIENIIIQNLSFRYTNNGNNIINNLNFKISNGDKLYIEGGNGTGKSTLVKLLFGLYSPTEGKILINTEEYSNFDKKSIRRRIGFVSQNVFLFKGTVLENILYGQVNKNKEDVIHLIKEYNLEEYIGSLENGLETIINQNGSGISGGQAQIISFLRAAIAKKDVLILDESTSNLDKQTEQLVFKILKEKSTANILIIISHQKEELDFINKKLQM